VAFAASLGSVPYPVLADFEPKGEMSKAYGVYNDERGTSNRAVIIIDKEGVVRWAQEFANAADIDPTAIMAEIDKL
jgi:alkyl hydroperoxide reductase subunit AhpC